MRRKLWILDLALLAGVVFAGYELRQRWTAMSLREQTLLKQVVAPPPPSPLPNLPAASPVMAANYMQAVQLMLFSRDRNPNLILDPPPPPPPPPQMPALPVSYGMVDIGEGPTAILAEKAGAAHRGYKPGDTIGEFKIVAMNNKEILFDWNGEPVRKTFLELAAAKPTVPASGHMEPSAAANAPAPAPSAATPSTTAIGGGSTKGPGADLGNDTRACVSGDATPAGTVENGMRKVVTKSPFGEVCRWEPVK